MKKSKKMLLSAACGMIFFLVAILILYYRTNLLQLFLERVNTDNFRTGGRRTVIFQEYSYWLNEHIIYCIFGTGAEYYREVVNLPYSVHNGLQNILVSYGIIGLLIFVILFFSAIKKSRNGQKRGVIAYYPLIAFILFTQTVQFLVPNYYMMTSIACFFVLRINYNSQEGQKDK